MTELRSTAIVPTDRSARWIKQLAAHLGRRAEVREEADGARVLLIAGATCRMSGDDAELRLAATAADDDALARVEHVVGSHLERFAAAEGLTVSWERTPPER